MRKLHRLFAAMTCLVVALPATATAQRDELKKEAETLSDDILKRLFSPHNWDVHVHGGANNAGRFMLQRPFEAPTTFGERVLRGKTGFSFGGGFGMDLLIRTGFRLDYTFASGELEYRSDNGDGTNIFDINDVGKIKSHTVSLEVLRYLLPARAKFSPYGSVGLLGTWWVLDQETPLVIPAGGSTQFRFGALASLGVRGQITDRFDVRLEAQKNSVLNPFSGHNSFRALAGVTIDEPTRVSQNDFRLYAVYHLRKHERSTAADK